MEPDMDLVGIVNDLSRRIEVLERDNAQLRSEGRAAAGDAAVAPAAPEGPVSRRHLLGKVAAAGVGAVAATTALGARPAAAANDDPILVGGTFTGTTTTELEMTGTGAALLLSTDGTDAGGLAVDVDSTSSAAGIAVTQGGTGNAIDIDTGTARAIQIDHTGDVDAVLINHTSGSGSSINVGHSGAGAAIEVSHDGSGDGATIEHSGEAATALAVTAAFQAATFGADGDAAAVEVANSGTSPALQADSTSGVGVVAIGGAAPLLLTPAGAAGPATTGTHARGEVRTDSVGDVYLCKIGNGSGGIWRRVVTAAVGYDNGGHGGSVGSAGSMNLLTKPFRLYDSRSGQPSALSGPKGRRASGSNTRLQVTGTVPVGGGQAVPSTAVGVILGITVVNVTGEGYARVVPAGVTPSTTTISWQTSTERLTTTAIVGLALAGKIDVKVVNSATNLVVDVIGFIS